MRDGVTAKQLRRKTIYFQCADCFALFQRQPLLLAMTLRLRCKRQFEFHPNSLRSPQRWCVALSPYALPHGKEPSFSRKHVQLYQRIEKRSGMQGLAELVI